MIIIGQVDDDIGRYALRGMDGSGTMGGIFGETGVYMPFRNETRRSSPVSLVQIRQEAL